MRTIITDRLWIGHFGDIRSPRELLDAGIRAVVQLSVEEVLPILPRDLIVCRYPLLDGDGNDRAILQLAICSVVELLEQRLPTFVCCGAGMSRSPTIAAAAISLVESRPMEEVIESITAASPIDVSTGLWNDVLECVEGLSSQRRRVGGINTGRGNGERQ